MKKVWIRGLDGDLDKWITANELKELRLVIAFGGESSYLGNGKMARVEYGMDAKGRVVTRVEIEYHQPRGLQGQCPSPTT